MWWTKWNIFLYSWLFLSLAWPVKSRADHEEAVHWAAHVGAGYVSTMTAYGLMKLFLGKEFRPFSLPMIAGSVLIAGALYDAGEPNKGSSFLRNSIGVGGAVGSILVFDF